MIALSDFIDRHSKFLVDTRRYLHQRPELSGREFQTTQFLAGELAEAGIEFRLGPENRGIVADLGPQDATNRIAVRADIDALAIQDSKEVDYRSRVASVMHACGHDAHSTILLGTVKALHEFFSAAAPSHAVRAIFQPEEESATGARRMIEFGVLDGVTAIFAAHVDPNRSVGCIGIRSGVVSAHCDEIFVDITGRSGHAARPGQAIDPIEVAVAFITQCYSAVPRYTEAAKQVVLSFTSVHGGQQHNVIPDHTSILGTMRSLDTAARNSAITDIRTIAANLERSSGATINIRFGLEVPSVIADATTSETVATICRDLLGAEHVEHIPEPSMGGEDFAFYSQRLPAAFIRLGTRGDGIGHFPLHNSHFDIDERSLAVGVNVMTRIALDFFRK